MLNIEQFGTQRTPMDSEYHPELDESPLCDPQHITKYKSLLGCANWIIILGRFDIQFVVTMLAHYLNAACQGH